MNRLPQRICLTGFMAAGKTTIARALAQMLGRACVDLDEFITVREGRNPRELIDEAGEAAFRDIETHALRQALEETPSCVLALGGGTWTLERNRALILRHDGATVWLDAPFDLCWQRIKSDSDVQGRPLARERDEARRLYDERRAAYEGARWRVVVSADMSAAEAAREIERALRDMGEAN
jgi:shikimate kinase